MVQESRNGAVVSCCCRPSTAVVRALGFHQCGLGLIPACNDIWVQFVICSCPAPRVFLRVLQFSSLEKPTSPNSKSRMNWHKTQNAPFFPSLKWGRGGLNFSFILSKIAAKADVASSLNIVQ